LPDVGPQRLFSQLFVLDQITGDDEVREKRKHVVTEIQVQPLWFLFSHLNLVPTVPQNLAIFIIDFIFTFIFSVFVGALSAQPYAFQLGLPEIADQKVTEGKAFFGKLVPMEIDSLFCASTEGGGGG